MEGSKNFKKVKYKVPEGYFTDLKSNTLNRINSQKQPSNSYETPLKWALGIAASLLVGFFIWFNFNQNETHQTLSDQENNILETEWYAYYGENNLEVNDLDLKDKEKYNKYIEKLNEIDDESIEENYSYYLSYDEFYDL